MKISTVVKCITVVLLVVTSIAAAIAGPTSKRQTNITYWKRLMVTRRFHGSTITTLTYYSTDPHGPIMSEDLQHGEMLQDLLAPTGMSGMLWHETGNVANLDFFSLVKLVKMRSREIGYNRVKKPSGWPADIHPFVVSPHFKVPAQPQFYASKVPNSIASLTRVGSAVFEGHHCLILQQAAIKLGSVGNMVDRFWWDVRTHYIWKEEDTIYSPPSSPNPPSRQETYVKWVRTMKRTPAEVFKFPADTRVVVPGILGNLPVPRGGMKIKPPVGSNTYLGLSFTAQLEYLESVKGTKNEIHYTIPKPDNKHK